VAVAQSGAAYTFTGTGFRAGETVRGMVHSDPVDLGELVADGAGTVEFTWTPAADFEPGDHTVVLTGADSGDAAQPFTIPAAQTASATPSATTSVTITTPSPAPTVTPAPTSATAASVTASAATSAATSHPTAAATTAPALSSTGASPLAGPMGLAGVIAVGCGAILTLGGALRRRED
jgi:hypothetical protein